MNIQRNLWIALTAGSLATAGFAAVTPQTTAAPQAQAAPKSDVPAALAKEAKVTLADARATALAKVPGGVVKSEELEREHGKLIYSFDIQVPGKSGVEEVNVNAITGKVVNKKHESAKAESREKRMERKPSTPPKP
ncbi:MAG TPA: PepSY domain-containing protein [Thermoanaerobaculia bacterium]|nr:PepSY domain-containing protein [Thermoanaerobaculia bacterium]